MKIEHTNGGIEQAFLELASAEGVISEKDKIRLSYLQSLPQNRTEYSPAINLMVAESKHHFEQTCKNQNL